MALTSVPATTGCICYPLDNIGWALNTYYFWLLDTTFYMPIIDSVPLTNDVNSNLMSNVEEAAIARLPIGKEVMATVDIDSNNSRLTIPKIRFIDITGTVQYLALTDVEKRLIWVKDLVYSNGSITLVNQDIVFCGPDYTDLALINIWEV